MQIHQPNASCRSRYLARQIETQHMRSPMLSETNLEGEDITSKTELYFPLGFPWGKLCPPTSCSIECGKCIINADIQRQFNELSTNFKNHQR